MPHGKEHHMLYNIESHSVTMTYKI